MVHLGEGVKGRLLVCMRSIATAPDLKTRCELRDSLRNCILHLMLAEEAWLYLDFAPLSFSFKSRYSQGGGVTNGGIIFHGPHDGYGSGAAPSFSVCLNPTFGWAIHT